MATNTVRSLLSTARHQASRASDLVATNGSAYYKQMMEANKSHVVGGATDEAISTLSKQLFYTTLASFPRRYQHMLQEVQVLKQKWAGRGDLTLQEVGITALFVGELYAWFCVGEIAGRGFTLTGYKA